MHAVQSVGQRAGPGRRHAAVLFVDLSGFTALVESVSPETVYRLVRPIMDETVCTVEQHGGAIQQILGDGFMSVFGLDPYVRDGGEVVQAVRAAVALVRQGGGRARLPVHVGVEAGEVLVSASWEPARFAVWGRAVTLAKRLCDIAGAGVLHVGPRAFDLGGREILHGAPDLVATRFRTRLKGIDGEAVAYRATARPPARTGSAWPAAADAAPARLFVGAGRPG